MFAIIGDLTFKECISVISSDTRVFNLGSAFKTLSIPINILKKNVTIVLAYSI